MTTEEQHQKKPNWQLLIEEQEKSGLSQSAFCKLRGIELAKFGYYRGRIKAKDRQSAEVKVALTPVKIINKPAILSDEIKLSLPNGFQFTFSSRIDAMQIKRLIEILLAC